MQKCPSQVTMHSHKYFLLLTTHRLKMHLSMFSYHVGYLFLTIPFFLLSFTLILYFWIQLLSGLSSLPRFSSIFLYDTNILMYTYAIVLAHVPISSHPSSINDKINTTNISKLVKVTFFDINSSTL